MGLRGSITYLTSSSLFGWKLGYMLLKIGYLSVDLCSSGWISCSRQNSSQYTLPIDSFIRGGSISFPGSKGSCSELVSDDVAGRAGYP